MDVVRALFVCGVIAGPLFVLVFLIEGAMTPDYDPLRHPVSSLALGPFGWTQTLNFIVVGMLTLAFAVGLVRLRGARQKVGGTLVGIWGVGLIGAGAFLTDPVSGYPPGTPPTPVEATTSGTLHDLFSVAAFFALGAACFVLAGGKGWRWAIYSVFSGATFSRRLLRSGRRIRADRTIRRSRRTMAASLRADRMDVAHDARAAPTTRGEASCVQPRLMLSAEARIARRAFPVTGTESARTRARNAPKFAAPVACRLGESR
jgi:Protein of unknown function (DUF998)